MTVDVGYKCKKCGRVYHKDIDKIPIYCKGCGNTLVLDRYYFNYTHDGKETRKRDAYGCYRHCKVFLSKSTIKVKLRKKWFKWVELIE